MALQTLSAFPYYGGKARMAPLICDMIDYRNTDIYIEPFGGGARVLLNKPCHEVEIYNDSSAGLCAFMRVMSNKDTAYKLISSLYETEYSLEQFQDALLIRNEAEDNFIDELKRQVFLYVKNLLLKYDSDDLQLLKDNIQYKRINAINDNYGNIKKSNILDKKELNTLEGFKKSFDNYMDIYKKIVLRAYKEQYKLNFNEFKEEAVKVANKKVNNSKDIYSSILNMKFTDIYKNGKRIRKKLRKKSYNEACKIAYLETSNNHDNNDYDDMKLAIATYIVYAQSRDGMGKDWSPDKYKTMDDYYSKIGRLYEAAERLEGVSVTQVGALGYMLKCSYLNNERAMFYLDPSYLKTGDEKKNLGTIYKDSFTYEDHEKFLKVIYKAKCKILISNYDTELYNKYLNENNGWRRIEVPTKTSVGGKEDNERTEVLWYNY